MHVLMLSLIDDRVVPGQDDAYEILDTARSLTEAGVSVTVAVNLRIAAGLSETSGNNRRIAEDLPATLGNVHRLASGVLAAVQGGRRLATDVSDRDSTLEVIPVPRLGVIPIRRAMRMPLAVLLQADLMTIAQVMAGYQPERPYDLIHSFGWRAGPAAGLLAQMMNLPLVVSIRDTIADRSVWLEDPVEAYSRKVWQWLLPQCEAVICPDDDQKEKLMDLFLAGNRRIFVAPSVSTRGDGYGGREGDVSADAAAALAAVGSSAVGSDSMDDAAGPSFGAHTVAQEDGSAGDRDPSAIAVSSLRASIRRDEKKILYHGTLRLTDGLRSLLEACAAIEQEPSVSLRMFLIGPASRTNLLSLGSCIRQLNLSDRIVFLKPQSGTGWWDMVLSSMDLMVLSDPVPIVGNLMWKALAFGCPLLACTDGALASWLRDRGLEDAVWQDGPRRWDRGLKRILFDQALREKLSEKQRDLVKGMQPLGERLATLYEHIHQRGGAEVRKGGEHNAVRIAEHGGGGGIR